MRWGNYILILILALMMPLSALAAGVGFAPNSGIWLSNNNLQAGQLVKVYAVIVSNEYFLMDAAVSFYDNNQLIDSVEVKALAKEAAKQIVVSWQPEAGEHTLSMKIVKATATDEKGTKTAVNVGSINGVVEETMTVSGQPSKDGNDSFQKNREMLAQAQQTIAVIATTTQKVGEVYDQTKAVVEKGQEYVVKGQEIVEKGRGYYEQAQEYWSRAKPYFDRFIEIAGPLWLKLTNNNEPKRVLIVVGIAVVVWFLVRMAWRRGEYRGWE